MKSIPKKKKKTCEYWPKNLTIVIKDGCLAHTTEFRLFKFVWTLKMYDVIWVNDHMLPYILSTVKWLLAYNLFIFLDKNSFYLVL